MKCVINMKNNKLSIRSMGALALVAVLAVFMAPVRADSASAGADAHAAALTAVKDDADALGELAL